MGRANLPVSPRQGHRCHPRRNPVGPASDGFAAPPAGSHPGADSAVAVLAAHSERHWRLGFGNNAPRAGNSFPPRCGHRQPSRRAPWPGISPRPGSPSRALSRRALNCRKSGIWRVGGAFCRYGPATVSNWEPVSYHYVSLVMCHWLMGALPPVPTLLRTASDPIQACGRMACLSGLPRDWPDYGPQTKVACWIGEIAALHAINPRQP